MNFLLKKHFFPYVVTQRVYMRYIGWRGLLYKTNRVVDVFTEFDSDSVETKKNHLFRECNHSTILTSDKNRDSVAKS